MLFLPEKKPWMDKLLVLHEYASQNQSTAKIFKAIADPPTTSLQRLKVKTILFYILRNAMTGYGYHYCSGKVIHELLSREIRKRERNMCGKK